MQECGVRPDVNTYNTRIRAAGTQFTCVTGTKSTNMRAACVLMSTLATHASGQVLSLLALLAQKVRILVQKTANTKSRHTAARRGDLEKVLALLLELERTHAAQHHQLQQLQLAQAPATEVAPLSGGAAKGAVGPTDMTDMSGMKGGIRRSDMTYIGGPSDMTYALVCEACGLVGEVELAKKFMQRMGPQAAGDALRIAYTGLMQAYSTQDMPEKALDVALAAQRVLILLHMCSAYCYICVRMLLHMCPHGCGDSCAAGPPTPMRHMFKFKQTLMSNVFRVLLHMCRHALTYVSAYSLICILMLLHMCPHNSAYVSSYCYICVLILLFMCPHTATYVSSY
jgi:hypothetical protein